MIRRHFGFTGPCEEWVGIINGFGSNFGVVACVSGYLGGMVVVVEVEVEVGGYVYFNGQRHGGTGNVWVYEIKGNGWGCNTENRVIWETVAQ